MKVHYITCLILLVHIAVNDLSAQPERKYIRQGNQEYENSSFDEAEIQYRKALEKDNQSYAGEFNLGDALYKQEKYEEAASKFQGMTENEKDKKKLSQSYYNMGNSLLKANRLEESINAFKNALRQDPGDIQTKHNLAYAQNLLQQKQEQEKQNQDQNQDQNKDQEQDQKDQQQNQDQQNQQDQDQQQQQQQNDQQQDQESQPQRKDQISKEDAARMLEALKQDEQDIQEKLKKEKAKAQRVRTEKEW